MRVALGQAGYGVNGSTFTPDAAVWPRGDRTESQLHPTPVRLGLERVRMLAGAFGRQLAVPGHFDEEAAFGPPRAPSTSGRYSAALAAHHARSSGRPASSIDAGRRDRRGRCTPPGRGDTNVVGLEPVALDPDDRAVIGTRQHLRPPCSEGGNRLERRARHAPVVLPVLLEVPAQRRLELQRLRLAAPDQRLGVAVGAQGTSKRKF